MGQKILNQEGLDQHVSNYIWDVSQGGEESKRTADYLNEYTVEL